MSTYVYGITRSAHPLRVTDRTGVGAEPTPLRVVTGGELAAIVSDAPEDLRPKRRDLEAHEEVLEILQDDGTVLPMRFGSLAPDDDSVRRELEERGSWYGERLANLDGRREINIKAFHNQDTLLAGLLSENEDLRNANEALRASGGGDQNQQLEFGEQVATAIEEVRARDSAELLAVLRPYASDEQQGPPIDGAFLNVSFLVDADQAAKLREALTNLGERAAQLLELRVSDPLPPYSFVARPEENPS